jgi:hypothetical protein
MNFFVFDPNTKTVMIAKSFWEFWAITVPITLLVIGIWNWWVAVEQKKDRLMQSEQSKSPQIEITWYQRPEESIQHHFLPGPTPVSQDSGVNRHQKIWKSKEEAQVSVGIV